MALSNGNKQNFQTLLDAASHNQICLVECWDKVEKRMVPVICAVNNGDEIELVPFAELYEGDQYERLVSPNDPAFPHDLD